MPNKKFLEEYPLYRKFKLDYPNKADELPKVPIHMYCNICKSEQTFNMISEYHDRFGYTNAHIVNETIEIIYLCSACVKFKRYFLIKFLYDPELAIQKVGQEPGWDIVIDNNLSKILGKFEGDFKKGLICESQGYGIGAYAYYRRVVEDIIDELLDSIGDLIEESEKEKYKEALVKTKKTIVAQEKIDLVKHLLPASLRPSKMNPLDILHEQLSEGLHEKSDEDCLEIANNLKNILIFLLEQIMRDKEAKKIFTESMRKALEKKKK
jgi:uncharacterized protein YutE (UPF0331/DUF86 family)